MSGIEAEDDDEWLTSSDAKHSQDTIGIGSCETDADELRPLGVKGGSYPNLLMHLAVRGATICAGLSCALAGGFWVASLLLIGHVLQSIAPYGLLESGHSPREAGPASQSTSARGNVPLEDLPPEPQCPCACQLSSSHRSCLEGDVCAYGRGWCTTFGRELSPPVGFCTKGSCNGPAGVSSFPNQTCGHPSVPGVNIMHILKGLPQYWTQTLHEVRNFDALVADMIYGLYDITMSVDDVLAESIDISFYEARAVWLVGCWPPQRFAIVSGMIRMPSGQLRINVAGVKLAMLAYGLSLHFRDLRADIECHGGSYILAGIGEGKQGTPVTTNALTVHGEIHVRCDRWSILCLVLLYFKEELSRKMVRELPNFVADRLNKLQRLSLGGGCRLPFHNTVTLLPYRSKECCEAAFAEDAWGCLVGGQFNGKVPGLRHIVKGVTCEPSAGARNRYTARCTSIPGHYVEESPGVCRESHKWGQGEHGAGADRSGHEDPDAPPGQGHQEESSPGEGQGGARRRRRGPDPVRGESSRGAPGLVPVWDLTLSVLHTVALIDTLLLLALSWCCVACCSYSSCARQRSRARCWSYKRINL